MFKDMHSLKLRLTQSWNIFKKLRINLKVTGKIMNHNWRNI